LRVYTEIPYPPTALHAVIETPAFPRDAASARMSEAERLALVDFLAANPDAGELMPGTGGA